MATEGGFRTTLRQQARRRSLRLLPLCLAIALAVAAGWWRTEDARPLPPDWRTSAAVVLLAAWAVLAQVATVQVAILSWPGPAWGRTGSLSRTSRPLLLIAGLSVAASWTLRWSATLETPLPIWGGVLATGLLVFGTLRFHLRQPADREPMTPELFTDQLALMRHLHGGGSRTTPEAMRGAILTFLIDNPGNRAARLLGWQMALRDGDISDAEHHLERLRHLGFPKADLAEMEALLALTAGDPARAASALELRVEQVRANPRRGHAGQRADFIVLLHLAHALMQAGRWQQAAALLDAIGADYETAPFAGSLDRLIVNHLRWRAARELGDGITSQSLVSRLRRHRRSDVERAIAALGHAESAAAHGTPEALRWWPQAARAAAAWWREARPLSR